MKIAEKIRTKMSDRNLGIGYHHKFLELIDAREASMTAEGRTYAAEVYNDYFIATAILSNSLAVRLIVNFFKTFYKNTVPLKMFAKQEKETRKWLRTFK